MRVSRVRGIAAVAVATISVAIGLGALGSTSAYASTTGSNQQQVFDWFVKQGLPPIAAAGLVGNFDYESNGVNPYASQCGSNEVAPPAGYCGVGIAQWTWGQTSGATRWQDLVGLANIEGDSGVNFGTTNPSSFPSLSVQEQYAWQELNTTYQGLLGQIESCAAGPPPVSAAIECATYRVQTVYEVPQNSGDENPDPGCATTPNFCTRYADAMAIYDAYAAPVAPQGLTVRGTTSSGVALIWQPSDLASSYEILRNGVEVGTSTVPDYADSGLQPETSYNYTVEAVNSNGVSGAATAVAAITAPAAPTLSSSASRLAFLGGSVTLAASAVGATSFNYAYIPSSGATWIKGWWARIPRIGAGGSVAVAIPPNYTTHPETYAFAASANNSSGISDPTWTSVTIAARKQGPAIQEQAKMSALGSGQSTPRLANSLPYANRLVPGKWKWGTSSDSVSGSSE